MSNWGRSDTASNSVPWALSQLNKTPNTANRDALFGNTTANAFVNGQKVGQFGVDRNEINVANGSIISTYVTTGGSGYGANAVVTLTFANGTTNAVAVNSTVNSTSLAGKVTTLNINAAGSGYSVDPVASIAAPAAINITANSTGFSNTTDTLVVATANSIWQTGDRLFYSVPTGNTPIAPLTGNTFYYVSFANTSTIKLAATPGGANIDLTDARVTNPGQVHTIRGDTATGGVQIGGTLKGVAHAGWVLRTEGTGGRAGRVQYETLVAMGSLGAQTAAFGTPAAVADASDDSILPDS